MVQRVSGLVSGIDTDALIQKMVQAAKAPVDKIWQQRKTVEWQRQALLDMNTKLYDFRNNKVFNFKLESNLGAKKVELRGYADAVSARAKGDAVPGTMSIKVKSLAKAASIQSDTVMTVKPGDKINVTEEITINGYKVQVNAEDTLKDVLAKITKETNVTAFYDEVAQKVALTSKETGKVNGNPDGSGKRTGDTITFSGTLFADVLKIEAGKQEQKAEDAQLEINGVETTRTSNTFTVNGIEVTLNQVSPKTADNNDYIATTLTTKTDTDKIVESIKAFINDYNEMLKTLQDKVSEKRFRDFPPLTEEQRKEMSDKEIELWEEKAKSGLLKNDTMLSQLISDMRLAMISPVDNGSKYNTISAIGIETGEYTENGKLYLKDEAKLRKAIEEDPQAIVDLFTANGNGDDDDSDVGIGERLYASLEQTMKSITQKVGTVATLHDDSLMGKQMRSLAERIDAGNRRVQQLEQRYYRQFIAMEQAIQRLNAQSSHLLNTFGGNGQ